MKIKRERVHNMLYSPLRYPGGKGKLSTFMKRILVDNDLYDGVYVEPYAGGAGIAFTLLFEEFVRNIVINDIDRSIYAFWYSVLNHTDELCKLIIDVNVTVEEWQKQRILQSKKEDTDILELGFSTFFLNRVNRSGIIKGGIIGGKSQNTEWKIDARFNKLELVRRIRKIAFYKSRITLHNLDAVELINNIIPTLPQETLIYFDPPYYVKGKKLYVNYYSHQDHLDLHYAITNNVKQKWLLTYDNTEEINQLYENYRPQSFELNYSANKKTKGTEMMYFSNNFTVPSTLIIEKTKNESWVNKESDI